MKMYVSGAMVGNISSKGKVFIEPTTIKILVDVLNNYLGSWYSRFKPHDAMKDGTLNEKLTFEKLKIEDVIDHWYELGLLIDNVEPYIGVSLGGLDVLQMDSKDDYCQYVCVAIKTRMSENIISAA